MANGEEVANHPYIPKDMNLPGFVPIQLPMSTIVGGYLIASLLIVLLVWIASGFIKKITKLERTLMCWWIFTGLTHIILEGWFVFSPDFYKVKTPFYLDELWKEYSKGDSRYAARDSVVVSVEGITAVLAGPATFLILYVLCYGTAVCNIVISSDRALQPYAIAAKKSYRYALQLVVSVAQLYGTLVYFITALLEGDNFAASPFYYFNYYVVANSFWIVIPTAISIYCWNKIDIALQEDKLPKPKKH